MRCGLIKGCDWGLFAGHCMLCWSAEWTSSKLGTVAQCEWAGNGTSSLMHHAACYISFFKLCMRKKDLTWDQFHGHEWEVLTSSDPGLCFFAVSEAAWNIWSVAWGYNFSFGQSGLLTESLRRREKRKPEAHFCQKKWKHTDWKCLDVIAGVETYRFQEQRNLHLTSRWENHSLTAILFTSHVNDHTSVHKAINTRTAV